MAHRAVTSTLTKWQIPSSSRRCTPMLGRTFRSWVGPTPVSTRSGLDAHDLLLDARLRAAHIRCVLDRSGPITKRGGCESSCLAVVVVLQRELRILGLRGALPVQDATRAIDRAGTRLGNKAYPQEHPSKPRQISVTYPCSRPSESRCSNNLFNKESLSVACLDE